MKQLHLGFFSMLLIAFSSFIWYRNYDTPIDKALYARFLDQFPTVQTPLAIDSAYLRKKFTTKLGNEYKTFIPALSRGQMSRMGPNDFFANALLFKNEQCTAVLYTESAFRYDANTIYLATYNKDGIMITNYELAFNNSDSYYKYATIAPNGSIALMQSIESKKTYTKLTLKPDGYLVEDGKTVGVATRSIRDKTRDLNNAIDDL